jgi:hypothetical protein
MDETNDAIDNKSGSLFESIESDSQSAAYENFIESLPKMCSPNQCNLFSCSSAHSSNQTENNKRKFDQCQTPEKSSFKLLNLNSIRSGKVSETTTNRFFFTVSNQIKFLFSTLSQQLEAGRELISKCSSTNSSVKF